MCCAADVAAHTGAAAEGPLGHAASSQPHRAELPVTSFSRRKAKPTSCAHPDQKSMHEGRWPKSTAAATWKPGKYDDHDSRGEHVPQKEVGSVPARPCARINGAQNDLFSKLAERRRQLEEPSHVHLSTSEAAPEREARGGGRGPENAKAGMKEDPHGDEEVMIDDDDGSESEEEEETEEEESEEEESEEEPHEPPDSCTPREVSSGGNDEDDAEADASSSDEGHVGAC